jgi:pimeloyl-ACP methyl ester carboxylesterase
MPLCVGCRLFGNDNALHRSFDKGFDVWMVTLRGCGRRRHVNKFEMRGRSYWNFNLDDHGNQDVACAVRLLHSTKSAELSASEAGDSCQRCYDSSSDHCSASDCPSSADAGVSKRTGEFHRHKSSHESGTYVSPPALAHCLAADVDVTLVAHSMGCAASIIYATTCLHQQRVHGITRAVFLAPAGYHAHRAPLFCRVLGPFIDVVMCRVTNAFCLPYGNAQFILGKLIQDVLSLPALRDLFAFIISGLVGGTLEAWRCFDISSYFIASRAHDICNLALTRMTYAM